MVIQVTTEIVTSVTENNEGLTGPEQGTVTITGPGGQTPEVEADPAGSETEKSSNENSSDDEKSDSSSDNDSDTPKDSHSSKGD